MAIEEIAKGLARFRENIKYFSANTERLKGEYPDEFIAVNCGQVLAHHRDIYVLMQKLDDMDLNKNGIYVGNTYGRKLIIMKGEA